MTNELEKLQIVLDKSIHQYHNLLEDFQMMLSLVTKIAITPGVPANVIQMIHKTLKKIEQNESRKTYIQN
jgi:molybdopterin-biosynthesis enzyme MoeA-like protein